ncbi:hypothetical protein HDV05_006783 [Chytridiales sp. JEL 0842]|nr:hypothetical protein HDV05_006783 [Chytridiales sp. JEL 0842]
MAALPQKQIQQVVKGEAGLMEMFSPVKGASEKMSWFDAKLKEVKRGNLGLNKDVVLGSVVATVEKVEEVKKSADGMMDLFSPLAPNRVIPHPTTTTSQVQRARTPPSPTSRVVSSTSGAEERKKFEGVMMGPMERLQSAVKSLRESSAPGTPTPSHAVISGGKSVKEQRVENISPPTLMKEEKKEVLEPVASASTINPQQPPPTSLFSFNGNPSVSAPNSKPIGGLVGKSESENTSSLTQKKQSEKLKMDSLLQTLPQERQHQAADISDAPTLTSFTAAGVSQKLLEGVIEESLEDFRRQIRDEIQNMHLEILRQFCIQKNEIESLFEKYSPTRRLEEELRELREENARLRYPRSRSRHQSPPDSADQVRPPSSKRKRARHKGDRLERHNDHRASIPSKDTTTETLQPPPTHLNGKPVTVRDARVAEEFDHSQIPETHKKALKLIPELRGHHVCMHYREANIKTFKNDVTFVTLATRDRLQGLEAIYKNWSGVVHLAYYIQSTSDVEYLESFLRQRSLEQDEGRRKLTVHIVWRDGDEQFPINLLRNVGQEGVKTTHMFHCDIDFVPSLGMREVLVDKYAYLLSKARASKIMLVVPAFEVVPAGSRYPILWSDVGAVAGLTIEAKNVTSADQMVLGELEDLEDDANEDRSETTDELSVQDLRNEEDVVPLNVDELTGRADLKSLPPFPHPWPTTKTKKTLAIPSSAAEAKRMLVNYELRAFHARCRLCQSSTNLLRWVTSPTPYTLEGEIPETYEPYVILPTSHAIRWNEHFSGYGRDKTLYFYELRTLLSFSTLVLPDLFITHSEHTLSEEAKTFRQKNSLETRVARIVVYDLLQDLLDSKYRSFNLLPQGHEVVVMRREDERKERNVGIEKSLETLSAKRKAKGKKDGEVEGVKLLRDLLGMERLELRITPSSIGIQETSDIGAERLESGVVGAETDSLDSPQIYTLFIAKVFVGLLLLAVIRMCYRRRFRWRKKKRICSAC